MNFDLKFMNFNVYYINIFSKIFNEYTLKQIYYAKYKGIQMKLRFKVYDFGILLSSFKSHGCKLSCMRNTRFGLKVTGVSRSNSM